MAKTLRPIRKSLDLRIGTALPKKADPVLLTSEHRAWRHDVLVRAGFRCEALDAAGVRCTKSAARGDRLVADHIVERKDGGDPLDLANGQCLCVQHNTLKGLRARDARMAERF